MQPAPVPYTTLTAGTSDNFIVQYETADRAANVAYDAATLAMLARRAKAVFDACEGDYATLCGWFGLAVGDGFGPDYRIQVLLTTTVASGGANQGYGKRYNGAPSWIHACPYPMLADAEYDVGVIGIVMAELAEILMSQTEDKLHWSAAASDGEGLSRVAAQLLHPGFVHSFFDPAPRDIFTWMLAGAPASLPSHHGVRQDWVSQTFTGENGVPGDADPYSFGCAILFIYYLKSQLGYSMAQIVQTGGGPLEDRFQSLTGRQGGFAPFKQLLDEFYPGAPPQIYDLFPVGGSFCRIGLATSVVEDTPPSQVRSGKARAGTLCGGGEFDYTFYDLHEHLQIKANVAGFASPVVTWTVNGVPLPVNDGILPMGETLMVAALVASADPLKSSSLQTEQLQLQITVGTRAQHPDMTTSLDIAVAGNPGQVQIRVDVTVHDAHAKVSDAAATSFVSTTLKTQELAWGPEYYRVQHECWNKYVTRHNHPLPWLRRFLPDPPPELLAAAHVLDELAAEVHQIAKHDRALAAQIDHQFGGHLLKRLHQKD